MSRPITTFSISLALSFFLMVQACNSSEVTLEKTMEITPNTSKEKTLLAVFAHPDDESTVGPVLAKYVREGATVHLVIATDGRLGVNDFNGMEAGCLLYTSPSPRDATLSRMPSSA